MLRSTSPAAVPLVVMIVCVLGPGRAIAAGPSGCVITVSPGLAFQRATTVTLSLSCAAGDAPTRYAWHGGFAQGKTAASVTGTVSATTTFSATASTSDAIESPAPVTVTIGGLPPPPPPTGCAGFANTRLVTLNWQAPSTVNVTGVGPNDAIVLQFTTGPSLAPNQYGNIVGAEYASQPSLRVAALSKSLCDFGGSLASGAVSSSNTVTVTFSVGANTSAFYPALQPNTVYFFNVKQAASSTCASDGLCDMYFQFHKPPGL